MLSLHQILQQLTDFKKRRSVLYDIEKIGVFGSYAREEQNEESDIDVCIKFRNGGIFTYGLIKDELENLFQKPIDLVSLGSVMQPLFKKSLERDAIFI